MKKTNIKKSSSGITLIALIITIIVLLILAGITIATIVEDDGVINKAQSAKTKTQYADKKEKVELAYAEATINENSELDEDAFIEGVHKALGNDAIVTPNEDGSYTVEHKGDIITISANGKAEQGGNDSENNPGQPDDTSLINCKDCKGDGEVSAYSCPSCQEIYLSDDPNVEIECQHCSESSRMLYGNYFCENCNGQGKLKNCEECNGTGDIDNIKYFCDGCESYVDEILSGYVIYNDNVDGSDSDYYDKLCDIDGHQGDKFFTTEEEAEADIENCEYCYYVEEHSCKKCGYIDYFRKISQCISCNGKGGFLVGETVNCTDCDGKKEIKGYKCSSCEFTKPVNNPYAEPVECMWCSGVEMEYGTHDCYYCDGKGVLYKCGYCDGKGTFELYECRGCGRYVEELVQGYYLYSYGSGSDECYLHDPLRVYITREEAEEELSNSDCGCEIGDNYIYYCGNDDCYYGGFSDELPECRYCDSKGVIGGKNPWE